MATIFISVGSNIERSHNIRSGIQALTACFGELRRSRVFESEALGFSGPPFYNMVVAASTELDPLAVVEQLKRIEREHGRPASSPKFTSRTLDLDLLLYDQLIMNDGVELPRRDISHCAFVLWPLAEIAADTIHPVKGQCYAAMWSAFDKTQQSLHPVSFPWSADLP